MSHQKENELYTVLMQAHESENEAWRQVEFAKSNRQINLTDLKSKYANAQKHTTKCYEAWMAERKKNDGAID